MIIGGPALTKYNDRTLRNLTTAPASVTSAPGALVHIKTLTASSSSTLSFVDGSSSVVLDNTYPIYKFEFINMHPANAGTNFRINFSADTGSNYNVTKTTTVFKAEHHENDTAASLGYETSQDLSQSTDPQMFMILDNANDSGGSGELYLFNPSSTTFAKYFMANGTGFVVDGGNPKQFTMYVAGYGNTTSAIDAVQFSMASGNIDAGTIKLYGIKDA
jgi:hypothetical protein|tara:strand:- start:512 stop:1165 length:654 start_codon:yes stop_codon:yes gene_type:complete